MHTVRKAQELATSVRHILTSVTTLPGEATSLTKEQVWDEIEKRIACQAQSVLDDVYAAGRAEGKREGEAEKKRVFELGKAEGRRDAQEQT